MGSRGIARAAVLIAITSRAMIRRGLLDPSRQLGIDPQSFAVQLLQEDQRLMAFPVVVPFSRFVRSYSIQQRALES